MTVDHEEDFLLSITIDTTHGDVDIIVTVDDMHARDVCSQNPLQVLCATVAYHLLCNEGGRHWYLSKCFCLAGGCGNSCRFTRLDIIDHVGKSQWVLGRYTVIGIELQKLSSILLCLLRFVEGQAAERQ